MLGTVVNAKNGSSHMIEGEAENVLKSLVAGDRFAFERKFKDPVHAVSTAEIMISTNALLRFPENTMGISRRILLVPFDVTICENRRIKNLVAELKATELPAIFNWAMEGLTKLNWADGFTILGRSK